MYSNTMIVKNRNKDDGYSLIELAIALVVIGLVIVPAVAMYQVQMVQERLDETDETVHESSMSMGGFRSLYGRYPCPASLTAVPGDLDYGLEARDDVTKDCIAPAAGLCVAGICAADSNHPSGGEVLIGALPFKTLNMQEFEAYDPYGQRVTYAVSDTLSRVDTFDMGDGRITILAKDGTHLTETPHGGHFAIMSYGESGEGGYTKNGVLNLPCPAIGDEADNCDMDATFVFGEIDDDYSHHMDFFSSVETSEWQISEEDRGDIHVKNNGFQLGIGVNIADNPATTTDDLMVSESASIRMQGSDDGNIRASGNVLSPSLCKNDQTLSGAECFSPNMLAGDLTMTGGIDVKNVEDVAGWVGPAGLEYSGISCGPDQFLVGIKENRVRCVDEIVMECPTGSYFVEINSDGEIVCDVEPIPCEDTDVTSWCGETLTVPATFDGGYELTYSGECYKITNYDASYWSGALPGLSDADAYALVESINNGGRTLENCNVPDNFNSQIRETYQCVSGTFEHVVAHEKRHSWYAFSWNITSTSSAYRAETSTAPYEAYGGSQPASGGDHDCWCREDYAMSTTSCSGLATGDVRVISKHSCPQTYNRYSEVYRDESQCACSAEPIIQNQSCTSYYNEVNGTSYPNGSLSGTVYHTHDVSCATGSPVVNPTPTSSDTSECACVPDGPDPDYTYCPSGTTNKFSWSWPGLGTMNVSGVSAIEIEEFVCPSSSTSGLPDPGSNVISNYSGAIPACTCDSSLTDDITVSCPSNLEGSGMTYRREWDCSLGASGGWEPEEDWELLVDDCNVCAWQKPSGSPVFMEYSSAPFSGGTCDCSADTTGLCKDYSTGGYDVYSGCQCVVQD